MFGKFKLAGVGRFSCEIKRLRPYQTLAIARGDKEKALTFRVQVA